MEAKKDIKKALAQSLKDLVDRMPFEKITIKEIADGAGVIRVTFYNHFQDKYDLLAWIVRSEILDPVRILISNQMYRESMVLIFSNVQRDKAFYTKALRIEGQNSFEDIVKKCAYDLILDIFLEHGAPKTHPTHRWINAENFAKYYATSMSYIMLEWIRSGMTISPEEMGEVYEYVTRRSMWDILDEV